jgi:hypothetical protein
VGVKKVDVKINMEEVKDVKEVDVKINMEEVKDAKDADVKEVKNVSVKDVKDAGVNEAGINNKKNFKKEKKTILNFNNIENIKNKPYSPRKNQNNLPTFNKKFSFQNQNKFKINNKNKNNIKSNFITEAIGENEINKTFSEKRKGNTAKSDTDKGKSKGNTIKGNTFEYNTSKGDTSKGKSKINTTKSNTFETVKNDIEYEEEEYSTIPPFEKMTDERVLLMASQNNDLDDLAASFCDDLINISKKRGKSAKKKSFIFEFLDVTLYLLILSLSGVVGILGIRGIDLSNSNSNSNSNTNSNASSNSNSNNNNNENFQFVIVGIFGFIIGILSDINRRFAFGQRSVQLLDCFHRFRMLRRRLNNLKVSGEIGPLEKLEILTKLQAEIDVVDMDTFDVNNMYNSKEIRKEIQLYESNNNNLSPPPENTRGNIDLGFRNY